MMANWVRNQSRKKDNRLNYKSFPLGFIAITCPPEPKVRARSEEAGLSITCRPFPGYRSLLLYLISLSSGMRIPSSTREPALKEWQSLMTPHLKG